MAVNKRQTNSCSPGYSFYTCAATGFKGCCSADACAMIDGCPAEQRDPNDLASMAGDSDATDKTSSDSSSTATDTTTSSPSVNTSPMTSASTSTPTVQSSSDTQAPLTTSGTRTGSGATAAAETATTANGNSSSNSPSKTPIIIGAVLGVVVGAVVIRLVWLGVRRRKRIRDEATKPEGEHWLQGQPLPGSDQSPGFYSDGYYSAASVPSKQGGSAPSSQSSPNNGGVFPSPVVPSELSAEPSPKPELSPNPETLEINKARDQSRLPSQSTSTTDGQPSPRHPAGGIEMRSNLEVSDEEDMRRGSHVMSWMSYANGAAGPGGGAG
ncbi:MAG: hypothetical protein L6R36_005681 [Xanthoria steineri]|nr:MAG: hypothetical protein L6R36_005681 [Xanthoria steineri]